MTSSTITITASDGHQIEAHQAVPAGKPRGGLVIVQTAFGISPYLRDVCAYYAAQGYVAIAPALYDRQRRQAVFDHSPESAAEANRLRQGLQWNSVLADIAAARDAVAHHGPTGIVGYCVGGSIAWLAAHELPFAAAVSYYGKDIVDFLDRKPACPVILHFGNLDKLITAEDVAKIKAAFPQLGIFTYHASHGFDDVERGYPDATEEARKRSLTFLREHLG